MKSFEMMDLQNKIVQIYEEYCLPVSQKYDIPITSFDILMFLGNNPMYKTAKDITEKRKIKQNLVSYHVDKLVKEGYIERKESKSDRRSIELYLTKKAQPVLKDGRTQQRRFFKTLLKGIPEESIETMEKTFLQMEENAEILLSKKEGKE